MKPTRVQQQAAQAADLLIALAKADPRRGRLTDELLELPRFRIDPILGAEIAEALARRAAGIEHPKLDHRLTARRNRADRLSTHLIDTIETSSRSARHG